MTSLWYALHVKPHKERPVSDLLEANGFRVYYPAYRIKPVNPRAKKERPFFPGYLFVFIDLEESGANALHWTEGTHGLVQFGGEPATVSEQLINELQQRLSQLSVADASSAAAIKKGDRVRITDGYFEGYEAIFDSRLPGKDRVQVLLTYLREQPKRLKIDPAHIEKLG